MNNFLKLINSNEWGSFYRYCNVGIFKQIDFFRYEDVHTNYLASLFKNDNMFELSTDPLKLLLRLLKSKDDNKTKNKLKNIDLDNDDIIDSKTYTQQPIKDGRLDLLIEFNISNKNYKIVIENKLLSEEGKNQTKKYQEYFEKQNNGEIIYVYLSLNDNPKLSSDNSIYGDYIKISYQDLIENVLEKCLKYDNKAPISIEEYLKGFTYLSEFDLMPRISKLESLADDIYNKYSDILYELLDKYDDLDDSYKKTFRVLFTALSYKDDTIKKKIFKKIGKFKNEDYGVHEQTKLVLKILLDLIENKKITKMNEIDRFIYNSGWNVVVSEDVYNVLGSRQDNYRLIDDLIFDGSKLYYSYPVTRDELKGFVDFVKNEYHYTDDELGLYY